MRQGGSTHGGMQGGSSFRERLGYYLLGVAIGFLVLGMFWVAKRGAGGGQQVTPPAQTSPQTPAPGDPGPRKPVP